MSAVPDAITASVDNFETKYKVAIEKYNTETSNIATIRAKLKRLGNVKVQELEGEIRAAKAAKKEAEAAKKSFESATAEMTRALGEVEGVEKGAAYTKIEIQLREELLEVKNLVSSLQKEQDKLVEAAVTAYFNTYGLKIEDLKIQAVAHA